MPEVEFVRNAVCSECGDKGAYNIAGDFLCQQCAQDIVDDYNPKEE